MDDGYGQLRQDIGNLMGTMNGVSDALVAHTEADTKNFSNVNDQLDGIKIQMSALQKMVWMSIGGVAVMGLQGVAEIINNFLIK